MKQKLIVGFSVILLLLIVAWIIFDLFHSKTELGKNPYDYGMTDLRKQEKAPVYFELAPLIPLLKEISAITVDGAGNIFVAGSGGIVCLDPGGKALNRFSIAGDPTSLTCLSDDTLVIGMTDHIEILTRSGKLISRWPKINSNTIITSIAATHNLLYIADAGEKVVYQYGLDGKFKARIGEKDPVRKIPGFVVPSPYFDVGINPSGELWVANTGRHSLEHYDTDGSLISAWGEASQTLEGFTGCCNPSHFTFLPDGSFVTSEKGIERVKQYSPEGKFLGLIAGPDSFDEGTRGLDLATDRSGRILVLDPARNQIRIFVPKK